MYWDGESEEELSGPGRLYTSPLCDVSDMWWEAPPHQQDIYTVLGTCRSCYGVLTSILVENASWLLAL